MAVWSSSGNSSWMSAPLLPTGVWIHLAFVYNHVGKIATFYKDGKIDLLLKGSLSHFAFCLTYVCDVCLRNDP